MPLHSIQGNWRWAQQPGQISVCPIQQLWNTGSSPAGLCLKLIDGKSSVFSLRQRRLVYPSILPRPVVVREDVARKDSLLIASQSHFTDSRSLPDDICPCDSGPWSPYSDRSLPRTTTLSPLVSNARSVIVKNESRMPLRGASGANPASGCREFPYWVVFSSKAAARNKGETTPMP